jgi:general stress protein 26
MARKAGKPADTLGRLLEGIDIAMLTTVGSDGYLVSRPLSTQKSTFDGRHVWFFTEADSPKVAEIRRHPKVNLAYASKEKNTYVSLAGQASVNRDRALIDQFWNDAMKAFFPKGKDDPNLVLLEVEPRTVEYWDGPGTFLGKAISFLVARVTKREEVMGENRMLDLRSKPARSRLPPSHADARPRAKKAIAKKTGAKKAAGKRGAAKKSPAKKAARKRRAPARR